MGTHPRAKHGTACLGFMVNERTMAGGNLTTTGALCSSYAGTSDNAGNRAAFARELRDSLASWRAASREIMCEVRAQVNG